MISLTGKYFSLLCFSLEQSYFNALSLSKYFHFPGTFTLQILSLSRYFHCPGLQVLSLSRYFQFPGTLTFHFYYACLVAVLECEGNTLKPCGVAGELEDPHDSHDSENWKSMIMIIRVIIL